jgi:GLPGLI family protein
MRNFILLFFFVITCYGQNYKLSYQIVEYYDIQVDPKFNPSQAKRIKAWKKDFLDIGENLSIDIVSDGTSYFYKLPTSLGNDSNGNPYKRPAILGKLGIYENVYFKGDTTYFYQSTRKFVTKVNTNLLKWDITGNTRIIDGYLCYEATSKVVDGHKLGFHTSSLVAWFCPELNVKAGPTRFGNLPGLIITLQNKFIKLKLTDIKEVKAKRLITLDEFCDKREIYSFNKSQEYYDKVGKMIEGRS